jgi:hypothetical protein
MWSQNNFTVFCYSVKTLTLYLWNVTQCVDVNETIVCNQGSSILEV